MLISVVGYCKKVLSVCGASPAGMKKLRHFPVKKGGSARAAGEEG